MRLPTQSPLTHRERLTRGLAHTAAGPVDVARGAVGLSGAAMYRGAGALRRRYRESRLAHHVAEAADAAARELAAAGEVVAGLPEVLEGRPSPRRVRRSWVIAGVVATALLAAGVVTVLVRRSGHAEEPSPRPPSVETHPKI